MTPERATKITSVLNARQPDLTLIADRIHKGRNLAAIVRSCDAVGMGQIHAVMSEDEFRPFKGTAMGSNQWVDVALHDDISAPIDWARQRGMQILVADVDDQPDKRCVSYSEVDYSRPSAIVMGSEIKGVSTFSREQADTNIYIPMVGMVESLNVSVAAAIILNEARAQRQRAGYYQQRRISAAHFQQLFFRWGYPRLAAFCQLRGIDFPPLLANGDIDDPDGHWRAHARALEAPSPSVDTGNIRAG